MYEEEEMPGCVPECFFYDTCLTPLVGGLRPALYRVSYPRGVKQETQKKKNEQENQFIWTKSVIVFIRGFFLTF